MTSKTDAVVRVPFSDLQREQAQIEGPVLAKIREILASGRFVLAAEVEAFEYEWASYLGVKHAVGVANGTDALVLTLKALGIGPGDEVITAANTFVATAEAIAQVGARPVLADVTPDTYTIDVAQVEHLITARTRAIIPVHLYGQPADMAPLLELVERHGLTVIEDAAQAHGATYRGHKVGALGQAAGFSFYPAKNLGAYGDAGIVATNDDQIAQSVRRLRNHGGVERHQHDMVGQNSRLDELQAGILRVKLPYLDAWNDRRRQQARTYDRLLSATPGIAIPQTGPERTHVYHQYVIRVDRSRRDALRTHLQRWGIETGIHYPQPVHLTAAFAHLGSGPRGFPVAEALAASIVSLPMYPQLTPEQLTHVARQIAAFVEDRAGETRGEQG